MKRICEISPELFPILLIGAGQLYKGPNHHPGGHFVGTVFQAVMNIPSGSGNVKVGPGNTLIHKMLQKSRRCRTSRTSSGGYIGYISKNAFYV